MLFPIVSHLTEPLSSTVFKIFASKYIGAMTLTCQGTGLQGQGHRSRNYLIPQVPFPIGAPLTESLSPAIDEIIGYKHTEVTT